MARNNLNIVVKVVDQATKKLQEINKAIQGVSGQIAAASTAMNKGQAGRVDKAISNAKKQHQLVENLNRKALKEDISQQLSKAVREKRDLKKSVTENDKVLRFKAAMSRQRAREEQKLQKTQTDNQKAETNSRLKNFKLLDTEQAKRVEKELNGRKALMTWNTKSAATAQRQAEAALGKKVEKEQKALQGNLSLNDKLNQKALQSGDKAKADALAKNQKDQAAAASNHQKLLDANASNQQKQAKSADLAILQHAKQRDKDAAAAQKALDQQTKADISQGRKVSQFRQAMANQRAREEKSAAKSHQSAVEPQIDLTKFNRTLFTMAAFVGTFAKLFGTLKTSIEEGADLDRITRQYERTFGESGTLIGKIRGFTTTAVDRMEAMQSAIALGNIGVAKNSTEAANIIAQAATASKMANVPVEEGIKKVTQSLKDGSLASLEFLNAIRTNDPGLKAHMAMLNKVGGVLSTALTAQQKHAIILNVLRRATQGQMFAERDLADVVMDVGQSFKFMSMTVGTLLGKALAPLIEKLTIAMDKGTEFLDRLKRGDKEIILFTKNIVLLGATIATTIAAFGTLRLGMMLFKSFGGVGFFGIGAALIGIAMAFSNMEDPMHAVVELGKKIGGVFTGVVQVVSSFFLSSQNYAKGVGKMDKQLADFLENVKIGDTNLLQLTTTIARGAIVIIKFVQDVVKAIETFATAVAKPIARISEMFLKLQDNSAEGWSRKWIDQSSVVRDTLINAAAVIGLAWGGKKLFGPALGMLGGKSAAGAMTGYGAQASKGTLAGLGSSITSKLIMPTITAIGVGFSKMFPSVAATLGRFTGILGTTGTALKAVASRIPVLGIAIALLTSLPTILSDEASRKDKFEAGGMAIGGLVGSAIGMAFGGPVGAFIGGVIGTFAGQKIGEILSQLFPEKGQNAEPIISWAPILSSAVQSLVSTVSDWIGNSDSLTEKIVKATAVGIASLSTAILTIPAAISLAVAEGIVNMGNKAYMMAKQAILDEAGAAKVNKAAEMLPDAIHAAVTDFTKLPFKKPDTSGKMFDKEGKFMNAGMPFSEEEHDTQQKLYNELVHTDIDKGIIGSGLISKLTSSTSSTEELSESLRRLGVHQEDQVRAILELTQELKNINSRSTKQGVFGDTSYDQAINPGTYMNTSGMSQFDKNAGFGWDPNTGAKTLMNNKIYDPATSLAPNVSTGPYAAASPESETALRKTHLEEMMKSAQGDQRRVLRDAMNEALKANSPEGAIITKEEYEEIYKRALDASAVAKNTKPKTTHVNKTGC